MAETLYIPPLSTKVDGETRRAFAALKSWAEKTGSLVTANDLISAGLAAQTPSGGLTSPNAQSNTTTPPAPSGFTVTGAFAAIILEVDDPLYAFFSHMEWWRAEVDDLGQAVKVATSDPFIYADIPPHASTAVTYYYWARIISTSNIPGPFNATAGTPGVTAGDPAYMLALLSGQISESELATALNTRLNGMEGSIADLLEGIPEGQSLANSALAAAESAAAAAASESAAITAEANAIAAANAAAGSEAAAGTAATSANSYASQSANSAGAAGAAATAAVNAKTAAEAANVAAGTAAQSATTHSDSAASYATAAGAAATAASASSTDATTSASSAATYAAQTSNSANNAATSATLAGTHAENAAASATTATAAASSATDSAVQAAQSASTALSYVGEAGAVQVEQLVRATAVGPNYSATTAYSNDKIVVYNNKIYQNNTGGVVGPEAFNAAHWTQINAGLYTQYSVKLDVNGYVSGFGMANDGSSSTFLVNCDKFAVGKSGAGTSLPFIVSGGVVYMRSAMIQDGTITNAKIGTAAVDSAKIADASITSAKIGALAVTAAKIADAAITTAKIGDAAITNAKIGDAAITTAKIGDAQVDTLQIKGNAVTVPVQVSSTTSINISGTTEYTIAQGVVDAEGNATVVMAVYEMAVSEEWVLQLRARLYRDSTLIYDKTDGFRYTPDLNGGTGSTPPSTPILLIDTPPSGQHTYRLTITPVGTNIPSSLSGVYAKRRTMVLIGAKR